MADGFAQALSEAGRLSGAGGSVYIRVIRAEEQVVAAGAGGGRAHRVVLALEFQTLGARPRQIRLEGEQVYAVLATAPALAASQRDRAYQDLALGLGRDAVAWLEAAPAPGRSQ